MRIITVVVCLCAVCVKGSYANAVVRGHSQGKVLALPLDRDSISLLLSEVSWPSSLSFRASSVFASLLAIGALGFQRVPSSCAF